MTKPTIAISAIWLRRDGDHLVVAVEIAGRWVTVIDEFDPYIPDVTPPHSHIVEATGITTPEAARTHAALTNVTPLPDGATEHVNPDGTLTIHLPTPDQHT